MLFNEHQSRLWQDMLKCIEGFRKGEVQYYDLVYELEGALNAGEFQDRHLIERWYDLWIPLEVLSAQKGNSVAIEEADKYLSDMELFLRSISVED